MEQRETARAEFARMVDFSFKENGKYPNCALDQASFHRACFLYDLAVSQSCPVPRSHLALVCRALGGKVELSWVDDVVDSGCRVFGIPKMSVKMYRMIEESVLEALNWRQGGLRCAVPTRYQTFLNTVGHEASSEAMCRALEQLALSEKDGTSDETAVEKATDTYYRTKRATGPDDFETPDAKRKRLSRNEEGVITARLLRTRGLTRASSV